ncbi:nucleotidyltransferase family protein [Herbaspirillum lusitanum]|uniref:Nucleotidyltransferase family protein n=1 Tax=Herbaspirillum lusitanum TaxID=213312 RepID=A0ABW9A747_9BURK
MNTAHDQPVVIILAAGKGERFRASGGRQHKLDAPIAGLPVLQHVIRAVEQSGLQMYIVRSASGPGMGDSIGAGVAAVPNAAGWLILPGDLPLVQPDSLQRVARALATHAVVLPQYQQQRGHPVGFRRDCFDALAGLSGATGASAIVQARRRAGEVLDLVLDDAGIVSDIDSVEDLARAEAMFTRMQASSAIGEK